MGHSSFQQSPSPAIPAWCHEFHTPGDVYAHGLTHILLDTQTPYQHLQIVDTVAYGKGLILDDHWQVSVGDEFLYHEPLVHTPCVFQGNPRRVLILGGGDGATAREVLRWRTVEQVVMVDIDGMVVTACRDYLPEIHQGCWEDPRLRLVVGDALVYLEQDGGGWDVIISDLTDPIEDGPAYPLFTQEHFRRVADRLAPGGFYMMQGGSLNPPELAVHARTVRTLMGVFGQVQSCFCYTPTYGVALGLILATQGRFSCGPDPGAIDRLLEQQVQGTLKMFDGQTLLGLLQIPKHIRETIARETQIYTLANPPQVSR